LERPSGRNQAGTVEHSLFGADAKTESPSAKEIRRLRLISNNRELLRLAN